ncbi:MAG: VCBS repeat-containing protein [Acidobacteria bacterium]|nr:VCBS repeat-containing protein [Acidobacteriota bacterium]
MTRALLTLIFMLACFSLASAVPQRAVFDFDGDNKTDYAIMRVTTGTYNWLLQQSTDGFKAQAWGKVDDQIVPGDYDGDHKWDVAIWRDGIFYIMQSSNGALSVIRFGQQGDDPIITQDFDGDGITDPAVVRGDDENILWYIQRSQLGFTVVRFGSALGDIYLRGDYDGDGKADVAVYHGDMGTPFNTFYVLRSSDGIMQAQNFGDIGRDVIPPADFDGDGKTDYAVFRYQTGVWYWINSSDGSVQALAFGNGSDRPVPGDYDGDGRADQAVWRPSTAVFYVNRSTQGFTSFPLGTSFDDPMAFTLQVR